MLGSLKKHQVPAQQTNFITFSISSFVNENDSKNTGLGLWCLMPFSTIFSYIVVIIMVITGKL
jgi:hypothetical protein